MKYQYKIQQNELMLNSQKIIVFGIECYVYSKKTTVLIKEIQNISSIKTDVAKLVDDFNRYQLSPIHFEEAIEDFLSGIFN